MCLSLVLLSMVLVGLAQPVVAQAQLIRDEVPAPVPLNSGRGVPQAGTTTWVVNTTTDGTDAAPGNGVCETAVGNNVCTLRAAIQEANALPGDDIIQLLSGTYPLTLGGINEDNAATGDLDIKSDLAIVGMGAATTTVDGSNHDRVFHVVSTATVSLSNITIRNGFPGDYENGGDIYNNYGVLIVSESVISNGRGVYGAGAGIMNDHGRVFVLHSTVAENLSNYGAIANSAGAVLTVTDCIFSGNDSGWGGALYNASGGIVQIMNSTMTGNSALYGEGIYNYGTMTVSHLNISNNVPSGASGGGIRNAGSLILRDSVISGNSASWGGGIINVGWMLIVNTTISGNSASASGGGVYNGGTLSLTNSTISDNGAKWGGGLFNVGGATTLNNVTLAYNTASTTGGGIYVNSGQVTLGNSILARHSGPSDSPDCSGTLTSVGYNLIENVTGCSITGTLTGNQLGLDPELGPLQDNGGSTLTRRLLSGSPAIDAGNPITPGSSNVACEAFDQRGALRPVDGDDNGSALCDIGAYEVVPPPDVQFAQSVSSVAENAGKASITVTVSAPSLLTVTAMYTSAGLTALPGSDYFVPGNTVIFAPGEINKAFEVIILDDFQEEPDETVVLTLTAASNAVVGASNNTTLIIVDNDSGPIVDLFAVNDSPTTIGLSTSFTATIAAGKSPTYTWDFGDGTTGWGAVVAHTYSTIGIYTTSVTADNDINIITATTPVTITNLAPVANAGPDQVVAVDTVVMLDGSGSYDSDGHMPLTYQWAQAGGLVVLLNSAVISQPTFTAPATPAVLTFTLRVTDAYGLASALDTSVVHVNDRVITDLQALNDSPTTLGHPTWFTTTAEGSNINYAWNFGDGATAIGQVTTHTYILSGTYTAVVTATNGSSSVVATTYVTITNSAPLANAGADQNALVSTLVTLDGSASFDPDGHLPLTYEWQQIGGVPIMLSGNSISRPTFIAPNVPTVLRFSLVVTDSVGLQSTVTATMNVTVTDRPVINLMAVNDSPTTLGRATMFVAWAEGSNIVYTWNFGDGATAVNQTVAHTYGLSGTYTAIVTASNGSGSVMVTSPVTITNRAPVAVAGPNQNVIVDSLVDLDGSASYDQDGHVPLAYHWTQAGGPVVLLNSTVVSRPTFTAPATPSVLTFTLRVTDAYGLASVIDTTVVRANDQMITGLLAHNSSPIKIGHSVNFTATLSAGSNVIYQWNFGDGVISDPTSLLTATHVYTRYGSFTAVVTATNQSGIDVAGTLAVVQPYSIYIPLMRKDS
jgi:CSLREA domain-containing protein